jgi:transposase
MPWSQTTPMDQKTQFIADYLRKTFPFSELCVRFGVSRETGYKLVERYLEHGPAGLEERSRRPHSSPNQTAAPIVEALLELRRRHPGWGAKKLIPVLGKRHPSWELPSRTTVFEILNRHGMVAKKRRRRQVGHPGRPTSQVLAPNDLWCADFKGEFKTAAGGELPGATAQVQWLPPGIQLRTAARGAGYAHAGLALQHLATGDADEAPATRIPRSLRGALRERQRRHSLEEARLGERLDGVHRRVRGAGGDRRWGVGRLLRPAQARALARAAMRIEDAYGRLKRHSARRTAGS